MGRRIPRDLRPYLEEVERRELLSAITDVMAGNSIADRIARPWLPQQAARPANRSPCRQNQGPLLNPDGSINNPALAPTGTLTSRELKKERFKARYVGTYTVGAGRTSDEADPDLYHCRRHRQHDACTPTSRCCSSLPMIRARDRRGQHDLRPKHQFQYSHWDSTLPRPNRCNQPAGSDCPCT